MTTYTPNSWVIIKISGVEDKPCYKVLAGWSGGYLDGDSWQLNSGIVKVEFDEEYYSFTGSSGSVYKCYKGGQEMRMSMAGAWSQLKDKYPDNVELVGVDEVIQSLND